MWASMYTLYMHTCIVCRRYVFRACVQTSVARVGRGVVCGVMRPCWWHRTRSSIACRGRVEGGVCMYAKSPRKKADWGWAHVIHFARRAHIYTHIFFRIFNGAERANIRGILHTYVLCICVYMNVRVYTKHIRAQERNLFQSVRRHKEREWKYTLVQTARKKNLRSFANKYGYNFEFFAHTPRIPHAWRSHRIHLCRSE